MIIKIYEIYRPKTKESVPFQKLGSSRFFVPIRPLLYSARFQSWGPDSMSTAARAGQWLKNIKNFT